MDQNPSQGAEGGNKIFLFIILALCVLIVVLLLLMAFGVFNFGGAVCEAGWGKLATTGGEAGGGTTMIEKIEKCLNNTYPYGDDSRGRPNLGIIDGAYCDCRENDCDDGVDNDGDGQIDCWDPDCNCMDCPECESCEDCEDSDYPACSGTCPDSQECIPTSGTTAANLGRCVCKPKETCERGTYPTCGGECPNGERCVPVTTGYTAANIGKCECQPIRPDCEDADVPACTGTCLDNQVCEPYRKSTAITNNLPDSCRCVPKQELECEDSFEKQCTGACPENQECQPYRKSTVVTNNLPDSCRCVPKEVSCEDSVESQCMGDCPEGQVCEPYNPYGAVAANFVACRCVQQEQDCGDITNIKNCYMGNCPENQQCTVTSWGTCQCMDVDCEDSEAPACTGDCPGDKTCKYAGNGECECVSESVDCEDSDYPACDGDCPKGQYCDLDRKYEVCKCFGEADEGQECSTLANGACDTQSCPQGEKCVTINSYMCDCIPEQSYSCGYISDTAYCSVGECPSGQECKATEQGCGCVTPCEDVTSPSPNTCSEGWCPYWHYCDYDRAKGVCYCKEYQIL